MHFKLDFFSSWDNLSNQRKHSFMNFASQPALGIRHFDVVIHDYLYIIIYIMEVWLM